MNRILIYIFLAYFIVKTNGFCYSQTALSHFKNLHPTDWQITSIYKLPSGIVLCGTEGGLIMHDGFKFTEVKMDRFEAVNAIYKLNNTKLLLIRENTIVEFDYDTWKFNIIYRASLNKNEIFFGALKVENSIYLGTSRGLQKWQIKTKRMHYLTTNFNTAVSTRSSSLSFNKINNEIIFGTKSGVITYKINERKASVLKIDSIFRCVLSVSNGKNYYMISSSNTLLVRDKTGALKTVPLNPYFDSGFRINNILEYRDRLIITSKKNGSIVFDYYKDTFLKNDPVFGSINNIISIYDNSPNENMLIGTTKGLISIDEEPKTFTVIKDSIPHPVHGCHAVYDKKRNSYYYLSKLKLIEFKIGYKGYTQYDISPYLVDNKNSTIDIIDENTLIIFGHHHIYFDLNQKSFYKKSLFNPEMENILDKDLIIDTYTAADGKLIMFSTYHSGLFVKDIKKDTSYQFFGSKLGAFSTICKIYPLSDHEFLMGANGFGGVFYLNINTFKIKHFPPNIFDKHTVSKSYVRNIFKLNNKIYFTAGNAIWEYNKEDKNIYFSEKRGNLREGLLFNETVNNKTYLCSKHQLYVLYKDDLNLIQNGGDSFEFAFTIPYNKDVGVYSNHKILSTNLGRQFKKLEIFVSHIEFNNSIKLCDSKTSKLYCKYDNPLINLSFFVNYSHFKTLGGKIYYKINTENQWQSLEGNTINFLGFKPGKYEINFYAKLKAEYSKIGYFIVIIKPPFYLNPVFWGLILVLLIIISIYLIRQRFKSDKRKKLKELELVLNSLEAERARISQDLHDGVSPNLSALKMILNRANLDTSEMIIPPEKLIDTTLDEIKEILHNITPDTLRQNGLAATISNYISSAPYERLKINLNTTLIGHRYSDAIEINMYRMFQEIFNNAIKYADCKEINIDLFISEDALCLMISDDGKGFDISKKQSGFGIQNIKSRVELVNGAVNFDSSEKSGTTVIIKVPINEQV